MKCGHHESLRVRSVESGAETCELCDTRSQRDDAVAMEQRYFNQRKELLLALTDLAVAVNAMPESDRFGAAQALDNARAAIAKARGRK